MSEPLYENVKKEVISQAEMNHPTNSVLAGDRFITLKEIKTTGLTSWASPCTGSFDCIIPEGTVLLAEDDQVKGAEGFGCVPEKYKEFEKVFVPAKDRYQLKYGGYYFSFLNEDIGSKLKLISRASISERKRYEFKEKMYSWFLEGISVQKCLTILVLYIIMIVWLPLRPLVYFYRKRRLDAQREAEEQAKTMS